MNYNLLHEGLFNVGSNALLSLMIKRRNNSPLVIIVNSYFDAGMCFCVKEVKRAYNEASIGQASMESRSTVMRGTV